MKNIERFAQHVKLYGKESFLVHNIPNSQYWLVCQKIAKNRWNLVLEDPLGTISYNLGTVSDAQHQEIWNRLIVIEARNQIIREKLVEHYKNIIKKYAKKEKIKHIKNKTK